jgi:signal transduction histidine kinase
LQQVFWNLLSNAIKFTPDGGSILVKGWVVDASPTHEKKPIAKTDDGQPCCAPELVQSGGVVVAMADSGIGIAPAEQSEIFDNFYIVGKTRHHSSSKTAFGGGGLGLGLPIARGIILAHGGQMWVESPGQDEESYPGSTFYVFLPFGNQSQ